MKLEIPKNINFRKIIEKGIELGNLSGNIVFVVPDIYIPDGRMIVWVSPKTQADLIKSKDLINEDLNETRSR